MLYQHFVLFVVELISNQRHHSLTGNSSWATVYFVGRIASVDSSRASISHVEIRRAEESSSSPFITL